MTPSYGLTVTLPGVSWADGVERTRAALAGQGFGVLTEIDVKATLKKKLDADFRDYVILGACHPPSAYQALTTELGIGLLLPCNVVVTVDDEGTTVVSAIDPGAMFTVVDADGVEELAADVKGRLSRALQALTA